MNASKAIRPQMSDCAPCHGVITSLSRATLSRSAKSTSVSNIWQSSSTAQKHDILEACVLEYIGGYLLRAWRKRSSQCPTCQQSLQSDAKKSNNCSFIRRKMLPGVKEGLLCPTVPVVQALTTLESIFIQNYCEFFKTPGVLLRCMKVSMYYS